MNKMQTSLWGTHSTDMAHMPENRITSRKPFANVAMNYCGSFKFVTKRQKGSQQYGRAFILLFMCKCTKMIHPEFTNEQRANETLRA
jgi:hypothetical protein